MKRALLVVVAALALLGMGKKPKGTLLWTGSVQAPAPFETFEIVEVEGKQELILVKGKQSCRFPLGTFTARDPKAWFDGARVGSCKVMDALRAHGEVSPEGGTIRLLGAKDPVDLVLVDVTKGK